MLAFPFLAHCFPAISGCDKKPSSNRNDKPHLIGNSESYIFESLLKLEACCAGDESGSASLLWQEDMHSATSSFASSKFSSRSSRDKVQRSSNFILLGARILKTSISPFFIQCNLSKMKLASSAVTITPGPTSTNSKQTPWVRKKDYDWIYKHISTSLSPIVSRWNLL